MARRLLVQILRNDWPVIADATNLSEKYRAWAIDAGRKAGAEILLALMMVSDDAAANRLKDRTSPSSATFETYQELKFDLEPIEKCSVPYLVVDSEVDISPHVVNVSKWLCGEQQAVPGAKTN